MTGPASPTVTGLTEATAIRRRAAGQGNAYQPPASRSYLTILRQNAYPGINGPLLLISAVLVGYGLYVEALLTAGPVVFNIVVGVVQESRAKRALDRIAILTRPGASVVRDGQERAVGLEEVVLGDLVVARRGDQVVVDGELMDDTRVELDEALLTGEADAIARSRGETVRAGTSVLAGTARYVATRVGADTTANQLIARSRLAGDRQTPLQREVARTIWVVAGLVVMTGLLVAVAGITVASPDAPMDGREALAASAVLITLVPQGLAIMLTVTYAAGALRISRLGALVQRQRAIESMSRVDTLCIDKTGTLTTQAIRFAELVPLTDTDGSAATRVAGDDVPLRRLVGELAASTVAPDRTTAAIAAALPATARPVEAEVPFASERRWSGLRFAGDDRPIVMGAAIAVLPALAEREVAGGLDRASIGALVDQVAADGHRVLLVARGTAGAGLTDRSGRPTLPTDSSPSRCLRSPRSCGRMPGPRWRNWPVAASPSGSSRATTRRPWTPWRDASGWPAMARHAAARTSQVWMMPRYRSRSPGSRGSGGWIPTSRAAWSPRCGARVTTSR